MLYDFAITEHRSLQSANQLFFETPYLHATRTLKVHDFLYMVDGEWDIGINHQTHKMVSDDILILPANITHYGINPCAPNTCIMYFHIYVDESDEIHHGETFVSDRVTINNHLNTFLTPSIKHLFQKILQTKSNPRLSAAYINTLLYELSELSANQNKSSLAKSICNYAVRSKKIPTNEEIASHFYISKRTAEMLFKKAYGTTIHEYILTYKLSEAKQYLSDYPDITLSRLAEMLGFCDEHHLSRAFKKKFGCCPRDFKKTI